MANDQWIIEDAALDGDDRPGDEATRPHEQPAAPRRRRGLRRALIVIAALVGVLVVTVAGGVWFLADRYAGSIDRLGDVFAEVPAEDRPAPARPAQPGVQDAPVTFLLVGSDTRGDTPEGEAPDGRSDAIILARVAADREHVQMISIPRDSWVDIPGFGMNKINASYAFGGPPLLIQTVEQLTGVRIDHFAAIDFDGLAEVTDALGGVEVVVAETTTNGGHTFEAGPNQLTGEDVRWYLGQRYGLPGGDFDRVKRQQQFLKAVMGKLISSETFGDLGRLDASLRAVGDSVAVDNGFGNAAMLSLAYSLRNLEQDQVDFFTAPVQGTGMEGAASVVYLNDVQAESMWQYLRTDSLAQNADAFAEQALPETPR